MTSPTQEKKFPDGMVPLEKKPFTFSCHEGVSCFTKCCRNVDMPLYPYDIIIMKNKLEMRSDEFLSKHVNVVRGANPFFPTLMMKMNQVNACPFLGPSGCAIYDSRPSACRMYPLERAVDRSPAKGRPDEFFFLTSHDYCMGHKENQEWTVKEWMRDQGLALHNSHADRWAEMDTFFAANPWDNEGVAGPRQQAAFLACYNMDGFRDYIKLKDIFSTFKIPATRLRSIQNDDEALLSFGYDWIKMIIGGMDTLKMRKKKR
jgi:Fe-S-cluster containining protein